MNNNTPVTYTLKGLKTWRSHDGGGWQVQLLANGTRIAEVTDEGNGGPLDWLIGPETVDAVAAFGVTHGVKELVTNGHVRCDTDADSALATMIDALEAQKQLKRWCKTKVLFTVPGDEVGSFRTIKGAISERIRLHIMSKYPTATIINDTL